MYIGSFAQVRGLKPRIRFGTGGGVVTYDPDASTLFARMTTPPSDTRKGQIDTLIKALKASGAWDLRDWYHFIGADAQATSLNWKSASYTLIPVSAPTFVADRYYMGDGAASYLNTQAVRNTLANYQQDSANISAWEVDELSAVNYILGVTAAGLARLGPRGTTTAIHRVNDAANTGATTPSSIGWHSANRSGASARQVYRNGLSIGSDAVASAALDSSIFFYLRSGTTYAPRQWAAGAVGGSLTPQQALDEYNAILAYMTAIGAYTP